MGSWKFLLKSITITGKGGSYHTDSGAIVHPRKGQGKVKMKVKMKRIKK